ncbi:hypothetical protein GCM10022214_70070 [Actinomadura miaoliensis]|uniref:Uncharacterized protein n=1 Tax=Actinomadura miaoliensis TaxID=430685 RepID=A0ABP7WTJ4_9ACTN
MSRAWRQRDQPPIFEFQAAAFVLSGVQIVDCVGTETVALLCDAHGPAPIRGAVPVKDYATRPAFRDTA